MKNLTHDRELWDKSEELLEKIKKNYNIFSVHMDDIVLTDIRGILIEYAEHFQRQNKPKRKQNA